MKVVKHVFLSSNLINRIVSSNDFLYSRFLFDRAFNSGSLAVETNRYMQKSINCFLIRNLIRQDVNVPTATVPEGRQNVDALFLGAKILDYSHCSAARLYVKSLWTYSSQKPFPLRKTVTQDRRNQITQDSRLRILRTPH